MDFLEVFVETSEKVSNTVKIRLISTNANVITFSILFFITLPPKYHLYIMLLLTIEHIIYLNLNASVLCPSFCCRI